MKFIILLILSFSCYSQTLYVDVNGGGDGSSVLSTITLSEAFSMAMAGTTVYIKAGNYGGGTYVQTNNGTLANPIKFIGCDSNFESIEINTYSTYYKNDAPDGSQMPLLQENRNANGKGEETAINIRGEFVELSNFVTRYYNSGVVASETAHNFIGRNLISYKAGDFNLDNSHEAGTNTSGFGNYAGFGIVIQGDYSSLYGCSAINAGAEGIRCVDNYGSKIQYCRVFSDDENINSTDYYFQLSGTPTDHLSNILVENCIIDRTKGNGHPGHGISLKRYSTNCTIRGNEIYNTNIEFQHPPTNNNLVISNKLYESNIVIANGANNVRVDSNYFTGINSKGVIFSDWPDGWDEDGNLDEPGGVIPWAGAGRDNLIVNNIFDGVYAACNFSWHSTKDTDDARGTASGNVFIYNTIKADYLIMPDRENDNTFFGNNLFIDLQEVAPFFYPSRQFPLNNVVFENNYSINSFSKAGVIATNSTLNSDFEPINGNVIGNGQTDSRVILDYYGRNRTAYDVGAVQSQLQNINTSQKDLRAKFLKYKKL